MTIGFPLHVNLHGNNCTIFGGSERALRRAKELLRFDARVTVISPTLCPELAAMSATGEVRHIPRRYSRGDCTNSQLCVAATDIPATNIAISTECKAKNIPVEVTDPKEYGNFIFPHILIQEDVVISIAGNLSSKKLHRLQNRLQAAVPELLEPDEPEET